ncbi:MAG: HD domain-containing protein [Patescibacteria group bacterium]|nr:HD domain-containing protein [Patescibacteria group bacterium]
MDSAAKKFYNPRLPYHNFNHALKVKDYVLKLVRRCKKYKIPVNREVVKLAALFHDAGYDQVKTKKEEFACKIAERELKKLGYQPKIIAEVQKTIMATKLGGPLKTTEQKILRAADLSGFMASYPKFVKNNKKIQQEYKLLYKKDYFPNKKWVKLLEAYLKPKIKLTPKYKTDNFHAKARKNIKKFLLKNKK